jgi:predicted acetyltransferase
MTVDIRSLAEDELPELRRITSYAFADSRSDEERRSLPDPLRPEWTTCAFVDGRLATTFGAYPFGVRLNGAAVPMAGVTAVATLPEFRRRGLLRQVMTRSFGEQRERGQSLAILWASLGAIYQRYGYGLASTHASYRIDPRDARFNDPSPASGRVRLMDAAEARSHLEAIYKAFARPRNLMLHRAPAMWDFRLTATGQQRPQVGVYFDPAGEARGYVVFTVKPDPEIGFGRSQHASVSDFAYLDPEALRGLWDFFAAHDLVREVVWQQVPEDDPVPHLLAEPNELQRRTGAAIWMRVTDVEEALRQRPYGEDGALSIRVVDPLCDWNAGVFGIETAGGATEVTRAGGEGDVTVSVAALAVLLAGHRSATQLARAGLVAGGDDDDKALGVADRLFATAFAPWCPDGF